MPKRPAEIAKLHGASTVLAPPASTAHAPGFVKSRELLQHTCENGCVQAHPDLKANYPQILVRNGSEYRLPRNFNQLVLRLFRDRSLTGKSLNCNRAL